MTRERIELYVHAARANGVERIAITEHLFRFQEAFDLLAGWWDEDRDNPALAPWLWGVNGATSVCASVLAVAIALSSSISGAFWAGWVAYAVALAGFVLAARRVALPAMKAA